jgi:hypothetical protein
VSDDYEQAARQIVASLGHDRARQCLDLIEQDDIRSVISQTGRPLDRDEELALLDKLQLLSAASDALDAIAWDAGTYADIDDAGRARMRRRLGEAMRRELGSM